MHTYIHTYIHKFIHTYLHTCINSFFVNKTLTCVSELFEEIN